MADVDLYLMHYPCTFARGPERFPKDEDETTYEDTWKALEKLEKTGKTKAIGVSNFSKGEVENLLDNGTVPPAVHQMEVPFTQWNKEKGIHVMQFSPLGNQNSFYRDIYWSNGRANRGRLIDEPVLAEIGKKYNKTSVHVVLAWGINHGRSVIPKSTIPWQIEQNLASASSWIPKICRKLMH
ncbi:NADP-dependent oxidoreductase domain-containing protein [Lipomyces doorenjongii]